MGLCHLNCGDDPENIWEDCIMPLEVFGGIFVCSSAEKTGIIRGKRVGMVVARDLREADLVFLGSQTWRRFVT